MLQQLLEASERKVALAFQQHLIDDLPDADVTLVKLSDVITNPDDARDLQDWLKKNGDRLNEPHMREISIWCKVKSGSTTWYLASRKEQFDGGVLELLLDYNTRWTIMFQAYTSMVKAINREWR